MKFEIFWKNPGYKIRPELKKDIECDYLIVGGGITGVMLVYFLAKNSDKKIVLIEKDIIASGATGKAAGTLVLEGEVDLQDMLKVYGREKAVVYWRAIHEALNTIKEVIAKENIKCDYEPQDALYASMNRGHDSVIFEEYKMAKDMEQFVEIVSGKDLKSVINTPLYRHAIIYKNHGVSVNPLAFTQNLSKATEKYGFTIYEHTPLISNNGHIAVTPGGKIKFGKIIMAIDSDTRHSKIKRRNTTLMVTEPLSEEEISSINMMPKKIVWDTKKSYHYFKLLSDNRLLIGYGDRYVHKKFTETAPNNRDIGRTKNYLKKLFPHLNLRLEYGWSGNYGVTKTHMPVLDVRGNKWSIGGAGSQVVCVMAARHIANKLLNRKSVLTEFFVN